MLSYFRYSVTAVLTKVAALLGMSSTPRCFEESCLAIDRSVGVSLYFNLLQLHYHNEHSVELLESLRVVEVRLVKHKDGAEHEYITAKIVQPNGASFYLAFERFRGDIISPAKDQDANTTSQETRVDATVENEASVVSTPTPQSTSDSHVLPASIRHSSDSSSPTRHADDKVTYLDSSHRFHTIGDAVYRTLNLSSTEPPLYLYELVILAKLLHDTEKQYLLRNKQCYFYAGTIVQVLQEVYGVKPNLTVTVNATGSTEGDDKHQLTKRKKPKSSKEKSKKNKAGTWKGIPIYANLSASNVKQLLEDFRSEVEAFKRKVIDSSNERQATQEEIERLRRQVIDSSNDRQRLAEIQEENERLKRQVLAMSNASTTYTSPQL